ncbi:from the Czech 'roh' meaning 'corner' [Striga asiatica]|uniref:From the Czech 'roh' meaning 'corner n=1 Tax=Striga asiatica TaxID=4170 RepID=A0A5A7PJQ0_STRAF|nr:from the Czech 'roh' meaning 'corner' [Striga asiatica]
MQNCHEIPTNRLYTKLQHRSTAANLHSPDAAAAGGDSSTTSAGGRTLPSANRARPFLGASCTSPSSSSAAGPPSPNLLLSTSKYWPSEALPASQSSPHRLHHLRLCRASAASALPLGFATLRPPLTAEAGFSCWRFWDEALKVMAWRVTPMRLPSEVLRSGKNEPVDC